eukprot:4375729-Amphidinium_carterae.1
MDNALQSRLVLDEFLENEFRTYSGRKRAWHALRWLQTHLAAPFTLAASSMPQRPLREATLVQRGQAVVVEPAMLFYFERRLDELKQRHDWRWPALA